MGVGWGEAYGGYKETKNQWVGVAPGAGQTESHGSRASPPNGCAPVSRPNARANCARETCQLSSAATLSCRALAAPPWAVRRSRIVPTPDWYLPTATS